MHFSIDLIFIFQLTEKRNIIQNCTRILQSFISGKLQENKRNTSFVSKFPIFKENENTLIVFCCTSFIINFFVRGKKLKFGNSVLKTNNVLRFQSALPLHTVAVCFLTAFCFSPHLGQYKIQHHGVCIGVCYSSLSSPSSISFKLIISNVPRPRVSALRVSSITL